MEENLKAALEYAVSLREGQEIIHYEEGKTYYDSDKASLCELDPIKYAKTLTTKSLTGLVDYLKSKFDDQVDDQDVDPEPLLIHVEGPTKVNVYSKLNEDRQRENIVAATALLEQFPYGRFLDSEQFIINVQSLIQRDLDAEGILKYASSIRIEGGGDLTDNGVSQTATVKQGAATLSTEEVPSPAMLRPYRTFLEVEQPASPFIFRIDKYGNCGLYEADGGIWRHEAMANVKEYLAGELSEEIEAGYLTIIA